MSKDINAVLSGWDYEPEAMQVRIVAGDDGRDKLQMRVDLGLMQMELSGRPDGSESLLDAFERRAGEAEAAGEAFAVDGRDCQALMREGVQYYHRYLAAFHLGRFDLVVRDTERNLRLFAFVVRHATRARDKQAFDQYRPYVTMMRSRAKAQDALSREEHAPALAAIDEGIEGIRQFLRDYDQAEGEVQCMELGFLLGWRREVESGRPVGPVERLERQLTLAVTLEEFEEASRIRDQLRRLRGAEVH